MVAYDNGMAMNRLDLSMDDDDDEKINQSHAVIYNKRSEIEIYEKPNKKYQEVMDESYSRGGTVVKQ